MTDAIQKLHALGQSLWYDNIRRRLLENGELAALIARGDIRGMTSNPSIFNNAISKSTDYDTALVSLAWAGLDSKSIFYQLAVEDIRAAADLFRPLYDETGGGDGYVSLEVDPTLADDTEATIAEARRLWDLVDRPNLMVKIPATRAGLPAIRESIAAGININVTLIFSLQRYGDVIAAYIAGLQQRLSDGSPVDRIASVASFFVSRVDSKVDPRLQEIVREEGSQAETAAGLLGKAAVANARLAYEQFRQAFGGDAFAELAAKGARPQRPLWASTSTKNPAYSDVKYVEELIGPDTVNTVPQETLDAFRDHGEARQTLDEGLVEARYVMEMLAELGISMEQVTEELEIEGVAAFAQSFQALMETIEARRAEAQGQLGPLGAPVVERVRQLQENRAVERLYELNASLWSNEPRVQAEIRERLGWLFLPETSRELLGDLYAFGEQVRQEGFSRALLLGMGGSSLASEVLSQVMMGHGEDAAQPGGLQLAILDSTDPAQVKALDVWTDVEKTLLIVSSKSGGTSEVMAFFDYFWAETTRSAGERTGDYFVAITDPGTSLEALGRERGFRQVFLADPTVGGRYSALSAFHLVPAALLGLNLKRMLDRAGWMAAQCQPDQPAGRNPGLVLGAILGEGARTGRDKLTLIADPGLESFGAWLEQLIAESTGKEAKGIVPVAGEPVGSPEVYGRDRLFVYLRRSGEYDEAAGRLRAAGHPVVVLALEDDYDLGAEFYRWEVATAVASAILGINSFDQPDVQDSKDRTRAKIAAYRETGSFDEGAALWEGVGVRLVGPRFPGLEAANSLGSLLAAFLDQGRPGDYVALNAYLPPTEEIETQLQRLRLAVHQRTKLATTVGFGPRFLHSTGQLHKGGPNTGLFLQFTADPEVEVDIPGQGITFGTLERAQALGDFEALLARGRRTLRIHLDRSGELEAVLEAFEGLGE